MIQSFGNRGKMPGLIPPVNSGYLSMLSNILVNTGLYLQLRPASSFGKSENSFFSQHVK